MNTSASPSHSSASPQPRVLHIDDGRLWRGGQHQVWLLICELAARGVAQRLAARGNGPLALRARESGIDVEPVRFLGELDLLAPWRIARIAQGFGANIIHAHTGHAHMIGLRAARRLPNARLVTTRRVDFPVGGFFARHKYTTPGQHFIAISEGVRRVLIAGGVAPERIDLVPSGVPPIPEDQAQPRETMRRRLGIGPDEIAIVNIGALTDHKGQRWLIEAAPAIFQAFPAARIHILGEGELRPSLESLIKSQGLGARVFLHGHLENARLMLRGFDLFVSSSHLEGLGTVILDAMLEGLPVVAAAAGGVPDVVEDGRTGRLAPVRNAAALAGAVIAALGDPETNHQMAAEARRRVEERFSAKAMAEGNLAVYRRLLGINAK